MAVPLDLYRLHFRLWADEPVSFPAGKAGNVLRGAFGSTLRKQFCRPQCNGTESCPFRHECAYAAIFEPRATGRYSNRPRPFVFRADHLDGTMIEAGCTFEFGINLFSGSDHVLREVEAAFGAMDSLGARRSAVRILAVERQFVSLDLSPKIEKIDEIVVRFRTPTELKSNNEVTDRPEFSILYARAVDRVNAFCTAPCVAVPCADVQLARSSLVHSSVERRSAKTGQRHRLGGFTGEVTYRGDLGPCVPILKAAEYTGVGRHASWGNGRIEVRRSS